MKTKAEYRAEFRRRVAMWREGPFLIGDLINEMADELGEKAYGLIDGCGLSDSQLYDFERVARQFPHDMRRYPLSWSYYRDAGADNKIAHIILEATTKNGWSRDQMREFRRELVAKLAADEKADQ